MTIEALVFDFDGLIIDTEWPSYAAWRSVFEGYGADLSVDDFTACIGTRGAIDFGALLADKLGVVHADMPVTHAELREIKGPIQLDFVATLPLLDGVQQWLEQAQAARIPCAIASSSERWWIEPHLVRLEIAHYFNALSTWDGPHVGFPPKPAPDIYNNAIAALNVDPARTIAFEDSTNGLLAAKAAGLWCVAVPNALTATLDFSAADHVIDSLANFTMADATALLSQP